MRHELQKLEKQLEALIEGSLDRWFGGTISPAAVGALLARAMEDGLRQDEAGGLNAPDQYALTLGPDVAQSLRATSLEWMVELARGLLTVARSHGYSMAREPEIALASDPTLVKGQLRVIAWHSGNPLDFTQTMEREAPTQPARGPAGAFLILDDQSHYALDQPVVNIGRRVDNQIVLEAPSVSRTHAQLRVREGRYVLFDLGSSSGTLVNGRSVTQHVLRPGDVIAIAATRLVYGEDAGGVPDSTTAYTPPFPPRPAGDQRTRTRGPEPAPDR
jgi:hypothetical protein